MKEEINIKDSFDLSLLIESVNFTLVKKYNYLIIPMSIYNILAESTGFIYSIIDEVSGLTKVGIFTGLDVYLDIHMNPNVIVLSWDKETHRDIMIENILNDKDDREAQIEFNISVSH